VSNVISCPNCQKKLAVKDEHKGRTLICPQCKGRFNVPADDLPVAAKSAAGGSGMDFLDELGPSSANPANSTGGGSTSFRSVRPVVRKAGRTSSRPKNQAQQMKFVVIGGGIALAVLVVAALAVALINANSGGDEKTKEVEDIRFGLPESTRIELFQKLVSAVDQDGITKSCKEHWYRLADEYKLDRSHIKDLLDEGFSFKSDKWVLPEATSTAKNRALRMDWVRQRTNGPDPVLAL
jgi:hypothetical protein